MEEQAVVQLCIGHKMAVVLAVSLRSLRRWWSGPVAIFADPTASPIVEQIAAAGRAEVVPFAPPKQKHNSSYAAKPHLPAMCAERWRYTLFIDADTLVVGSIESLWPESDYQMVLTRFSNWDSNGKHVGGRIKKWQHVCPELVKRELEVAYPAVNTGIFSFGCLSELAIKDWPRLNDRNADVFMSDEISCQLLLCEKWGWKMLDDRWNCSPAFGTETARADPRIYHLHGRKAVTKESYRRVWWPEFRAAWLEDCAGLRSWCPAGDKRLRKFLEENPLALERDILSDGQPVVKEPA